MVLSWSSARTPMQWEQMHQTAAAGSLCLSSLYGFDGTTRVCQVSLKSYLDGSKSQGCHLETVLVLALSSKSLG